MGVVLISLLYRPLLTYDSTVDNTMHPTFASSMNLCVILVCMSLRNPLTACSSDLQSPHLHCRCVVCCTVAGAKGPSEGNGHMYMHNRLKSDLTVPGNSGIMADLNRHSQTQGANHGCKTNLHNPATLRVGCWEQCN